MANTVSDLSSQTARSQGSSAQTALNAASGKTASRTDSLLTPSLFPTDTVDLSDAARASDAFRSTTGSNADKAKKLTQLLTSSRRALDLFGQRFSGNRARPINATLNDAVTNAVSDIVKNGNPAKTGAKPQSFWQRVVGWLFG